MASWRGEKRCDGGMKKRQQRKQQHENKHQQLATISVMVASWHQHERIEIKYQRIAAAQ